MNRWPSSILRRQPWVTGVVVLVLLGAVPSVLWEIDGAPEDIAPTKVDPRYATQSGHRLQTRRQHVVNKGNEDVDSAVETCAGLGTDYFAERFAVVADPETVARIYAEGYEPAFRDRAYRGCLEGLVEGG